MKKLLALLCCLVAVPLLASERPPFSSAATTHFNVDQVPNQDTVLLAFHNASDQSILALLSIENESGSTAYQHIYPLAARATQTLNFHDLPLPYVNGKFAGAAFVSTEKVVLVGDAIFLNPTTNFAHANQLIPIGGVCVSSCTSYIIRYMQGGAFNGGSLFTVSRDDNYKSWNFLVHLYDEAGNDEGIRSIDKPLNFELTGAELTPQQPFGVAYFTFNQSAEMMGTYRANGKFSTMLEPWCDTCDPCSPYTACYNPQLPRCNPAPPPECTAPGVVIAGGVTTCTVGVFCSASWVTTGTAGNIAFTASPAGLTVLGNTVSGIAQVAGQSVTGTITNSCGHASATLTTVAGTPPPVPSIHIKKYTNGDDADLAPGPTITVGGAVHWTYIVSNTGNTALSNVTVVDSKGVSVTCPKNALALAETMTCTGNGTATLGQYENTGTTCGFSPLSVKVCDDDPSHYKGVNPPPPPTCEEQYPISQNSFSYQDSGGNLSGSIHVFSGLWNSADFHIYASDTMSQCNVEQYHWDKTHITKYQACGNVTSTLPLTYHWDGHTAQGWRFVLKNGNAVVWKSACIYNPHHGNRSAGPDLEGLIQ